MQIEDTSICVACLISVHNIISDSCSLGFSKTTNHKNLSILVEFSNRGSSWDITCSEISRVWSARKSHVLFQEISWSLLQAISRNDSSIPILCQIIRQRRSREYGAFRPGSTDVSLVTYTQFHSTTNSTTNIDIYAQEYSNGVWVQTQRQTSISMVWAVSCSTRHANTLLF